MIPERGIKIPPDQLSPDTLRGVIEEFVTRDGTELTDSKIKIEQVQELLRRGDIDIWFDRITQTCSIQVAE
jgi:uncharacterized protein